MKAIVYEKRSFPNGLTVREVQKPVPGDDEVLVKIQAVSVNAADYRSMKMGIIPKSRIFGADIAGRIEAVGQGVSRFKPGDDVFGDLSGCGSGGFAEYVTAPESALALVPSGVSYETAAAVPMAAVTALQALRKGQVRSGQKVLIYGAGGGVGTFAVQLAKHFGARLTAVCGPRNVDLIQSMGADTVIDYTREDFDQKDDRYDLVLALNGSRSPSAYRRVLAPKGVCILVGGGLSQIVRCMVFGGKRIRLLAAKPSAEDLACIIALVAEGRIRPVIDRRYPLCETVKAVKYLSEGHARGKVLINT